MYRQFSCEGGGVLLTTFVQTKSRSSLALSQAVNCPGANLLDWGLDGRIKNDGSCEEVPLDIVCEIVSKVLFETKSCFYRFGSKASSSANPP